MAAGRRGRKPDPERAVRRHEEILDAAARLFAERGEEIAAASGRSSRPQRMGAQGLFVDLGSPARAVGQQEIAVLDPWFDGHQIVVPGDGVGIA